MNFFQEVFAHISTEALAEVGANCRELLGQGLLEDFNMAACGFILKVGGHTCTL